MGLFQKKQSEESQNDELSVLGYYVRRRMEHGWEWYCEDEKWHLAAADIPEKKLLDETQADVLMLKYSDRKVEKDVQLVNKNKERCNKGYQMFSNKLMAHSFGGMDGKTYHNTEKALENGISNGYKYFETDFSCTADGRLVLCHGWSQANCRHTGFEWKPDFDRMTYRRIRKMKVHGNPVMDVREFRKWMKQHPEYYFEIDFHNLSGKEIKNRIKAMLSDFKWKKNQDLLDRLLIQAYSRRMFEDIDSVYHFKHYQYLVGENIHDIDNIITYALDHGICVLALRMNLAKPELVRKIRNAGLYVMCYTVNRDLAAAQKLLDSGVNTLCTDFITEEMLQQNQERMGIYPFYVYYNSGAVEAVSHYEPEGESVVERVGSGNWEYKDQTVWENDGRRPLEKCKYSLEGKNFAGWNLRIRIDGKQLWYCKDHMYHGKGDFKPGTKVEPYLFHDGEVIPEWTFKRDMKLIMVAVWEDEKGI